MKFEIGLPLLVNWKNNNYNVTLVIVDYLTKKIHYIYVKIIIDIAKQAKVIIDIVIK